MSAIGAWVSLPHARGTAPGVAGVVTVLASRHELTAWCGERVVVRVTSEIPVPGRARLVGARPDCEGAVHWGPWVADLRSGTAERLDALATADDEPFVPVAPGRARGGPTAVAYAWSADGRTVAVSAQHADSADVVLREPSGRAIGTIWTGSGPAPTAVWAGRHVVVVGDRRPMVLARDGTALADLDASTPPVRIEADDDETRLLVVEHGRLSVWDTSGWEPFATADGSWLDAAIGPAGTSIAALDLTGRLHLLDGRLRPLEIVGAPRGAGGVALGEDRVVVCGPDGSASAALDH